jgi:hypothetical protein
MRLTSLETAAVEEATRVGFPHYLTLKVQVPSGAAVVSAGSVTSRSTFMPVVRDLSAIGTARLMEDGENSDALAVHIILTRDVPRVVSPRAFTRKKPGIRIR